MLKFERQLFLSNLLLKLAATKSKDLDALRTIFISKYPGERAAAGLAIQYYNKFIKISDPNITLEEGNLNPPLPSTFEELKKLIQETTETKTKTKIEELSEKIKEKHSNVDLSNLSEDYLSWIHLRYVEGKKKPEEIVHPIEEALVTLRKFPSIQNKYNNSSEFKEKVNQAGYPNLSSIKDLTLDEMEEIIILDTSELTVRVEGVDLKPEEFLGKFGEWNLWLPHTKETSAKIAGYDENYNPKTTWCTARTKGSNLFYDYIGSKDAPSFLFYIIKDDPKRDEDWLSLGYISSGARLIPDFSGKDAGISVNRANKGLREEDYTAVLKEQWIPIKSRIELEIEKYKVSENGKEKYVSPGRAIIENLAKDVVEFKKEFKPKSNVEKKDFMDIILESKPSDEVKKEIFPVMARIDSVRFLTNFLEEEIAKPYLDMAAKSAAEKEPIRFLDSFSEKDWAGPYLKMARKSAQEKNPISFLRYFSKKDWAGPYLETARKSAAEKDSFNFLFNFSEKDWVGPYLETAVKSYIEKDPIEFLKNFSEKDWAKIKRPELEGKSYLDMVAKPYAEKNPFSFLNNFSEKDWVGPYLETAVKPYAEKNPSNFLYHFSEKDWAQIKRTELEGKSYLEIARKVYAEKDPFSFLNNFSEKDWAKPYLETARKSAVEKDPINFLFNFSEKDWVGPYLETAAKPYAEKDPSNFLYQFSEKDWAQIKRPELEGKSYLEIARKVYAEKEPARFLNNFSKKDWAKPYLETARKSYAEKEPITFLILFSKEDWVGPYLNIAAKLYAEENPVGFLNDFYYKDWAQPYFNIAAAPYAEKEPAIFLNNFSNKDWAQPYLDIARKSAAEKNPINFLNRFSKEDWAKIKRPELGGRSYVDLAEEKQKEIKKTSSYYPKLIKLAKILRNLNLSEESNKVSKLINN